MFAKLMKQLLSMAVCSTLLIAGAPAEALQEQASSQDASQSTTTMATESSSSSATPSQSSPTDAPAVALQTADQLDSLVAPIALILTHWLRRCWPRQPFPTRLPTRRTGCQQNSNLTGSCPGAGRESAVLGSQREGAHAVSFCAERSGEKPLLDFEPGTGLCQSAV